jgi:hypothetical protein
MQFVCPAHLEVAPDREYRLFIGDQTVRDCGAPCRKMFFTDAQLGKKSHRGKCIFSCFYAEKGLHCSGEAGSGFRYFW